MQTALLSGCSFSRDHNIDCDLRREVVSGSDHVLLIGDHRRELKAIPPNYCLLVVAVSPKGVEPSQQTDRVSARPTTSREPCHRSTLQTIN